ncbi:ABC transporter substrate-binding protein, partial [Chloroflexi bacterium TSY]|nr:ABC transporter substrate-binding protein [Chloroflexi bacterium TSY]
MAKHYLSQFLPKYSSEEEVTQKAKDAGFESWVEFWHVMAYLPKNPELPTMGPWMTVKPVTDPIWTEVRNPYYWVVDTEGNQLPYIDEIVVNVSEDREVLALRGVAGEYDFQSRHIAIDRLPVLLENAEAGGYDVNLRPAFFHNLVMNFNHSYNADAEIQKWIQNVDFRRALSLGFDRDQINEAVWLGLGVPGSVMP